MQKFYKSIFFLFLFIVISCKSKQIIEKENVNDKNSLIETQGKATYLYQFKPRKYILEQETTLYFENEKSVFYYNKGKEPFVAVDGANGIDGYMQDEIGDMIYKDIDSKETRIREKIWGKPFYTEESLPIFNWTYTNEKKMIGSFECFKAVSTFRGRTYEAWFTTKIPFRDGPWKFNGLPGLILEVYDKNNDYRFSLKTIELPDKEPIKIEFINDGEYLPFSEFIKAEDVEFEKEKKKAEAKYDGAPGTFTMTKNPTNNIELIYE